jgi:ABC-type transport system involved in cytochrome c biogenesis ATPase subunit
VIIIAIIKFMLEFESYSFSSQGVLRLVLSRARISLIRASIFWIYDSFAESLSTSAETVGSGTFAHHCEGTGRVVWTKKRRNDVTIRRWTLALP